MSPEKTRFLYNLANAENGCRSGTMSQTPQPLNILCDGDSYFDYPLTGILPIPSGIPHQLPFFFSEGLKPKVVNIAHAGDSPVTMLSLDKAKRLVHTIKSQSPPFDALLISSGGDQIIGEQFVIWLNDFKDVNGNPNIALNTSRLTAVIDLIVASYMDLIQLRDDTLPGVPIFTHIYDFIIPSSEGILGICGPWVFPSLQYCGWIDPAVGASIIKKALIMFAMEMRKLASVPSNNLIVVETQGLLRPDQFANEVHPNPEGFKIFAKKFYDAIAAYPAFRGRM